MRNETIAKFAIGSAFVGALMGCQPAVVDAPPSSTTIIHDKTPANVVVTPPAPTNTNTHTDTTTNTSPDGTPQTSTTTTTTGG